MKEKIKQDRIYFQKLKKDNNNGTNENNVSKNSENKPDLNAQIALDRALTVKRYSLSLMDAKISLNFQLHFLTKVFFY